MNIAAYCRVSTDKADQLNSLEAQKEFFSEYTKRTGDTLVRLYADEGISGTKIKNRKEFLRMMADADTGRASHVPFGGGQIHPGAGGIRPFRDCLPNGFRVYKI